MFALIKINLKNHSFKMKQLTVEDAKQIEN